MQIMDGRLELLVNELGKSVLVKVGWRPERYFDVLDRVSALQARDHAVRSFAMYATTEARGLTSELASFMQFYGSHFQMSRSQYAQDIFVMYATDNKRGGVFLEIGGGDGVSLSNSLALARNFNWRGALVEPDPVQFVLCKAMRKADAQVMRVGVSPRGMNGRMQLIQAGVLSALSGYEGADGHAAIRRMSRRRTNVDVIPISEVIRQLPPLDYLSLDIEGAELSVLETLDWSRIYRPKTLTVEHNGDCQRREALTSLLVKVGYRPFVQGADWLTGSDSWFVLKSD